MERLQTLINRLQEQVRQNADVAQMQLTLQLLQAELNQLQKASARTLGTSKVAVVMPTRVTVATAARVKEEVKEEIQTGVKEEEAVTVPVAKAKPKNEGQLDFHFDPMNEIPT